MDFNFKDPPIRSGAILLTAIKQSIQLLTEYYLHRNYPEKTIPYSVPYIHNIDILGTNVPIKYVNRIKVSENSFVFVVEVKDQDNLYFGRQFVVKITNRYCVEAHKLLAGESRHTAMAPQLFSALDIGHKWKMVVMELITSLLKLPDIRALEISQRSVIIQDITRAIKTLHDHGFVHGDIRYPNILVTNNPTPRAYIIDFEFSGKEGVVQYPENTNLGVLCWVPIEDFPNVLKSHDLEGLKLYSRCVRV